MASPLSTLSQNIGVVSRIPQSGECQKGNIDEVSSFMLMSDDTANGFYQRNSQTLMPVMKKIIQAAKILSVEEVEIELAKNFRETLCQITTDDCSLVLLEKCAE